MDCKAVLAAVLTPAVSPRKARRDTSSITVEVNNETRFIQAFADDLQRIKDIRIFQRLIEKDVGINGEEHRSSCYHRGR